MASSADEGRTLVTSLTKSVPETELSDPVEALGDEPMVAENEFLECGLCDYRTKESSDLEDHVRGHTGEKPFQCPWPKCNYECGSENDLLRHCKEHRAKYPYRLFDCPVCPLGFRIRRDLMKHIAEAHQDVPAELAIPPSRYPEGKACTRNIRPNRWCKLCGIEIPIPNSFKAHKQFHLTGYVVCNFEGCGQRFVRTCHLRQHVRTHHLQRKEHTPASQFTHPPHLPRSYNTRSSCKFKRIDGVKYDASIRLTQPKIVLIPLEKQISNRPTELITID